MDTTALTPSTRPCQAINNADTLVALYTAVKTDADLVQWQQLADRELGQLAQFSVDGQRRLQNAIVDQRMAQDIDEHIRASVEANHIQDLLDQLDIATGILTAARRQRPASMSAAPRGQTESTKAHAFMVAVLVLIVITGITLGLQTTPAIPFR